MDRSERVEHIIAKEYGKELTGRRKAIGDFMLSDRHAVNVKSNNVNKKNYSPNMISIKKMHDWVYEKKNDLSFIFVDYETVDGKLTIIRRTDPVSIESLSWDCLSIEAQGYGVIQRVRDVQIISGQNKREFYRGFLLAYEKYRKKEEVKHIRFAKSLITDLSLITW